MTPFVLAIDPGREKCGVAIVDDSGAIVFHAVVPRIKVTDSVASLLNKHGEAQVVIGNATGYRELQAELQLAVPQVKIALVNETGSTLEARGVYWQENPPRGWRRLLPLSLQTPPVAVDDYAAVVLARRFLTTRATDKDPN